MSQNLAFGSLYSLYSLYFFPTLWAVNVSWHEAMGGSVYSYAEPKGRWFR